jgi:hypothetical protein
MTSSHGCSSKDDISQRLLPKVGLAPLSILKQQLADCQETC